MVTIATATTGKTVLDAVQVLRDVLEVQRESDPTLDIDSIVTFAIAHPDQEVVDSMGAVTVVCMEYGAYTPDNLIPHHLLTHDHFSTLNGLRTVVKELNQR